MSHSLAQFKQLADVEIVKFTQEKLSTYVQIKRAVRTAEDLKNIHDDKKNSPASPYFNTLVHLRESIQTYTELANIRNLVSLHQLMSTAQPFEPMHHFYHDLANSILIILTNANDGYLRTHKKPIDPQVGEYLEKHKVSSTTHALPVPGRNPNAFMASPAQQPHHLAVPRPSVYAHRPSSGSR